MKDSDGLGVAQVPSYLNLGPAPRKTFPSRSSRICAPLADVSKTALANRSPIDRRTFSGRYQGSPPARSVHPYSRSMTCPCNLLLNCPAPAASKLEIVPLPSDWM